MTQTTHTPGPWTLKHTDSGNEFTGLVMADDGTSQICDTGVAFWYNRRAQGVDSKITNPIIERANANARLIAAAPELLEAGLMWVTGGDMDDFDKAIRAAINKAKGV